MKTLVKLLSVELTSVFSRLPLDIAYLYGSRTKGKSDSLSDYDFGVLFSQGISKDKRFDMRLRLFGEIGGKLGVSEDKIDVVDLQEVPSLLQFNIINGKIIYCKNVARKLVFESYVMARYHDDHYILDEYFKQTLKQVAKGGYFERGIPYH